MLNRTVMILPMFMVISLGIVVLFVVLGLRGPTRELKEARHAMDRRAYDIALNHLNRIKNHADQNDTDLLTRVVRMRAQTYERLGDRVRAIKDLGFLIDDLLVSAGDLVRDRIRLLNEIGATDKNVDALDRALRYCKRWLATNREDGMVLGLAGQSRQILAGLQLAEWKLSFESRLPDKHRKRIGALIDRLIYSTNPSQGLALEIDRLADEIDVFVPGYSLSFYSNIERIQKIANSARDWFLKALAGKRSDVAAYEGIATQLRAAGDDDTLLMLAHTHLSRVKLRDSFTAAFDIADIHVRHNRFRAVLEIAERTLPLDHIGPRFYDGTLDFNGLRLLACRALAINKLGDKKAASALLQRFARITSRKRPPYEELEPRPFPLSHFILGTLIDKPKSIEAHLTGFTKRMKDHPWYRERLTEFTFRRLSANTPPKRSRVMYKRWMHYEPKAIEPVHALSELLLSLGDITGANRELVRAIKHLPNQDASLELLSKTQLRTSGLDLDWLIRRANQLGVGLPDEVGAFPALTIALGRHALAKRQRGIAMACALQAKKLYPRSRIPHYMHAETLLANGEPDQAARVIRLFLEEHPADPNGLHILALAREAAGHPTNDLRFAAILSGNQDLAAARYLAQQWLARGDYKHVITLANSANEQFGEDLEMLVLATRAVMLDSPTAHARILPMLAAVFKLSRGVKHPTPRQQVVSTWVLGQYVLHNRAKLSPNIRQGLMAEFLTANKSAENLLQLAEQLTEHQDFEMALRCYRDLAQDDRYQDFRQGVHLVTAAHVALRLGDATKARELLTAAMAFDDGSRAILDLTLLDLAIGEEPSLPKGLPVHDVLDASLIARAEPKRVINFLVQQLKANPNNLACQCIAAVLNDKATVSPHVRKLATTSGPTLLTLIALLQQPPFGRMATGHAEKIVAANPDNPVAHLLLAKAHGQANQLKKLQAAFDKIRDQIGKDVVLIEASLQILGEVQHPALQHNKVKEQLAALAMKGGLSTPAPLLALVLKQNSAILKAPGTRKAILPMVKRFWMLHPKLSGVGLAEVEMLMSIGSHQDALALLRKIEPLLSDTQRDEYLALYYRAAMAYSQSSTIEIRDALIAEAMALLKSGEVNGAPLHFLLGWLDEGMKAFDGTEKGAEIRGRMMALEGRYLKLHIEEGPATTDAHIRFLEMSLERIGQRHGHDRAMDTIDGLLRRNPSLIPIWRQRARWLVRIDRIADATDSLMWIPMYLDSPEIIDTLVHLLARSGQLVERGQKLLTMKNLATASKLSLGLAEMRMARYQTASRTLGGAKSVHDGAHLYYHAAALLALQVPESLAIAKTMLGKLVRENADSSYAGSAATVLAVL